MKRTLTPAPVLQVAGMLLLILCVFAPGRATILSVFAADITLFAVGMWLADGDGRRATRRRRRHRHVIQPVSRQGA